MFTRFEQSILSPLGFHTIREWLPNFCGRPSTYYAPLVSIALLVFFNFQSDSSTTTKTIECDEKKRLSKVNKKNKKSRILSISEIGFMDENTSKTDYLIEEDFAIEPMLNEKSEPFIRNHFESKLENNFKEEEYNEVEQMDDVMDLYLKGKSRHSGRQFKGERFRQKKKT